MATRTEIINVRLPLLDENHWFTLTVENGVWVGVDPQSQQIYSSSHQSVDGWRPNANLAVELLDAEGKVMLPGLVDSHMHLDKAFSLNRVGNESGTLQEAVRNYAAKVASFSKEEIRTRIRKAALQSISFGTTSIRTHLDFHVRMGREIALRTLEAALEVKEEFSQYLTLQLFPMIPPAPLTAPEIDLIEEALRMGVDGIGGAPHLSPDPKPSINLIFRLAEKYDRLVDIHTDESDNPEKKTVAIIADVTRQFGYQGRVTVDHLCSLASMPDDEAWGLIEAMRAAELSSITLPAANLYLQGRADHFPVRRGITRVKEIRAAGIPIATASDNIQDPFHPFGRADLLQIALITAYGAHMGSACDIRNLLGMVTEVPAQILGLTEYGITVGNPAKFVLFDAHTPEEIFSDLPERRWVYGGGHWMRIAAPPAHWEVTELTTAWNDVRR